MYEALQLREKPGLDAVGTPEEDFICCDRCGTNTAEKEKPLNFQNLAVEKLRGLNP